jgi:hypothetical protein
MMKDAPKTSFFPAGQTIGLELEMGAADRVGGRSRGVTDVYFERLAEIKRSRGESVRPERLGSRTVALVGPLGHSGLDNGFNLLETSFDPLKREEGGLKTMSARVIQELGDVLAALEAENLILLNASEHPDCPLDQDWYLRTRVNRPIYDDWVESRRWRHFVGIDAKAQNGPCTSVDIGQSVRSLNVVLALAPAFIALFANSPLASGAETGLKEHRLVIWEEMFRDARHQGDLRLCRLPERPFEDLGDYFRWMFGPDTVSQALPQTDDRRPANKRYKSAPTFQLEGEPSLERFLRSPSWPGRRGQELVSLTPQVAHFAYAQFAHFLDARWRYVLGEFPGLEELLHAWDVPGGLEELFARCGASGYIEGRASGCALPDRSLLEETDAETAMTAPLSASAVQLGLLRNLVQAETLIRDKGWSGLRTLRPRAVRLALEDDEVFALVQDVLDVARDGLTEEERPWLAYADFLVQTRRVAADRMLTLWRRLNGDLGRLAERISVVV